MPLSTRFAAALALACLTSAAPVHAGQIREDGASAPGRTVSLDDILAMETFGTAALSPDGSWVAWERRRPYDTAPRFDRSHRTGWAVSELKIAPVAGGAAEPLLPPDPDGGLLLGSWSPDSRRLLVFRLRGGRLEAGVVEAATRAVVWTGLTPDLINGVSTAWLDADRLVLTTRPDHSLPWLLRFDGTGQVEMSRRWERTAAGREPSRTRIETRAGLVTVDAKPPELTLVVLDLRTGERRTLAEGAIRDFAVSPDGRRIAVLKSAEGVAKDPGRAVQSAIQTRSRLTLVDVTRGAEIPAGASFDVAPHLLRWSEAGDAVLVWAREDGQVWADARLWSVGLDGVRQAFETDHLQPFEEGRGVDELRFAQAEWLDGEAVLRARRPGEDRFDWWRVGTGAPRLLTAGLARPPARLSAVSGGEALAFADGRLWAFGGERGLRALTAEGEALTDGETFTLMTPSRIRANETPRRTWVAARSAAGTEILRDGVGSGVRSTQACDGALLGRSAVETAVLTLCLDGGVETLALAAPATDRVLDRVNEPFGTLRVPQPRPIPHLDRLGRQTTSYLYLPPGRRPDEVKGLIVMVYPGSVDDGRHLDATVLGILSPKAQVLASEDYAVLWAALTLEEESLRPEMIGDFVRGADLAIDAALAATPGLPEDRMAVLGHSFGGYTALAIATRPTRFRSVVAWAAPADLAGKWGEFGPHARLWPEYAASLDVSPGSVEGGQAMMDGPPWADVEGYAAASPTMLADRITAPILLITADRDYVPMTSSERMLTAMHRQGKWARMITYWGETHSNASPANVRDVYREIFDWLDRTLGEEALRPPEGAAPMPEPSPRSPPSS